MDNLSRRIRDANPYADGTLPQSAEAGLQQIYRAARTNGARAAQERRQRTGPWRVGVPLLLSGVLALVVAISVSNALTEPERAAALVPDNLAIHPISLSLEDVRDKLRDEPDGRHDRPGAEGSPASHRGYTAEEWSYRFNQHRPAERFVQAQIVESVVAADGTSEITVTAGQPTGLDGRLFETMPEASSLPGTILHKHTRSAEEMNASFPGEPPEEEAAMRAYLTEFLGGQPQSRANPQYSALEFSEAAQALLKSWTLSPAAERALIAVLVNGEGASIGGGVTDRAGREGVMLSFERLRDTGVDDGGVTQQLVIDIENWRVLASEHTSTRSDPDLALPVGAVLSYTMWR